ncbi:response regulator transcription factor [Paenibacillus sp. LHD-117]|uniref:response regulator transcription factor n=1 Tax=Paenibacillus sp. LHD-117 TaxID=3071412 RepID=UPI0027E0042C|nr:response regulator transcription factor [Paenibacillus sp. LHD-117]MDQ6420230.1 response regulator transcription factor [Paenibacillus sp. LHD-117]
MATTDYCKVLIVDDEILIRQGIKHFMDWEREGFHIVGEAANGKEALELIAELRPHIVITDIVMPVMDGEELTKQIKQQYPEIEVIILSSFGEFDYVRSTFQSGVADYILKPKLDIQHLLTVLKMTAERIPSLAAKKTEGSGYSPSLDRRLERLLSGYDADVKPEEVKAAFPHAYFCLAGFDARGLADGPLPVREKRSERLAHSFDTVLAGAVRRELPLEGPNRAFLINADRRTMDMLPEWARGAAGKLAEFGPRTPIAITAPFGDIGELHSAYNDSLLKLLGYSFYLPDRDVLLQSELPAAGPPVEAFHLNRFTEEFKRGQFRQAFGYLREHAQAMASAYTMDVFEFKSFLGNLVFNITVLLGNMAYDIKELEKNKYRYFKEIEDARFAAEALACLEGFIGEAEACIADKAAVPGNANMKKLLDYIHEHYAEPLNLTEMAKHFHFNPSYLSSYFSAHNNEGFVDYLHKVRIEKAEELLCKEDATISEIGGMVGYADHSYFCKVFKKLTGLSPSRYRRQFANEEKGQP